MKLLQDGTTQRVKILMLVKTYPTLSTKYDELVCTAGITEDGQWVRLYPLPFRLLEDYAKFKKWQWVELEILKNTKDFRPESYRPYSIEDNIKPLGEIGTGETGWRQRRELILHNVRYNMSELIEEAYNPNLYTSLALLKPKEIKDFIWEDCEREWDKKKLYGMIQKAQEGTLFDSENVKATRALFKPAAKIPYQFKYVFTTEDNKVRKLMIEDWEIGMLYLNCMEKYNDEKIACQKVKERYFDDFVKTKDLYFIVGTNWEWHNKNKGNSLMINPFMIIGLFHPPYLPEKQPSLFEGLL